MINLQGKTLVFGDLHIGVKSDSLARLFVDVRFVESLLKTIKERDVDNVVFLGDWFNSREFINTITLSVGFELASIIAKNVKNFVFILGNHDLESNSYQNVSSVIGYDSIRNLHLIKEPTEGVMDGKPVLFVPWGFADYPVKSRFKYMFGHFNLPGSSIRFNRVSVSNLDEIKEDASRANDIRTFCDCLDVGGIGFSGHIHVRSEQTYHQHRVIFAGSPIELSFGEVFTNHGYYIIDNDAIDFVESGNGIPRHITLRISDCFDKDGKLKDQAELEYLKGNIVKKIIDKDLTSSESMQLNDLLNSSKVFEFTQAEYGQLATALNEENAETTDSTALTFDSYFDKVVQAIDEETLKSANVTKEELKTCFMEYVSRVTEG